MKAKREKAAVGFSRRQGNKGDARANMHYILVLKFTSSLGLQLLCYCLYTPLNAENPPSTATTVPVTNSDAGERSHNTTPWRSSGFPKRLMGV